MPRTWSFTDLELVVLWEQLGVESLPWPLDFIAREQWWDEYLVALAQARGSLREREENLAELLAPMGSPDVKVEVHGWDGRDRQDPAGSIRILGLRQDDLGYLIVQHPGETVRHSAGFTVTECYGPELATEIVRALPDSEAGRGRDVVLAEPEHADEFDYGYGLSPAHETMDGTVVDQAADFLATDALRLGVIEVVQGRSRFGPRGITRQKLQWRDIAEDGRYLVTGDFPPVAAAADQRRMITTLDTYINEVLLTLADE
ncbi:ESX secretion-associated protein EspG [Nocardia inohanensis]|uniref:ESX secretion-associated protein EspG n=1 Tax=Nocardia inohanensis TaxID=209246 RepID=UPI00082C4959|nr:ESX secretion-associated protein EspG [Nocardia inohanensis]